MRSKVISLADIVAPSAILGFQFQTVPRVYKVSNMSNIRRSQVAEGDAICPACTKAAISVIIPGKQCCISCKWKVGY
jgi:hypothetical protein